MKEELEALKKSNLYRSLKSIKIENPFAYVNGRKCLLLSSNDYLGLSSDIRVINAAKEHLSYLSQCSSRLIAGNDPLIEEFEYELAKHKGYDRALVYPNGYMANLAISSLVNKEDLILSDELNHASIIDACKLSKARVLVYKHNSLEDLDRKLKEKGRRKLVVTEGVFSMDGDFMKRDIAKIARENGALLVVDDAHGDFIYGSNFKGTQEELCIDADIIISSMSKALGTFGGYIASRKEIIEYMINRSRSFIYTSALPAHLAAASLEALKISKEGSKQKILLESVSKIKKGLTDLGFMVKGESHIIPIIVGSEITALNISDYMLENGIFIQAIRYPTVAMNNARLRLTLTSLHHPYIDDILIKFKLLPLSPNLK